MKKWWISRVISIIFAIVIICFKKNLTLYEFIYLELVIINIQIFVEVSCFFMKKMTDKQKKNEFIFKQLDNLILELQKEELIYFKDNNDYPKYLLLHKKIDFLLKNINNIIDEEKKIQINEIEKEFSNYREKSSESIQDVSKFNERTIELKKSIQKIENCIIKLQTEFFKNG